MTDTIARTEATVLNRLEYRIEFLENTRRVVDGVECDNYTDADLMSDAADTIAQLTEALQALYEYASADPGGIEPDLDLCCKTAIALGANPVPEIDYDKGVFVFQPPASLPFSRFEHIWAAELTAPAQTL